MGLRETWPLTGHLAFDRLFPQFKLTISKLIWDWKRGEEDLTTIKLKKILAVILALKGRSWCVWAHGCQEAWVTGFILVGINPSPTPHFWAWATGSYLCTFPRGMEVGVHGQCCLKQKKFTSPITTRVFVLGSCMEHCLGSSTSFNLPPHFKHGYVFFHELSETLTYEVRNNKYSFSMYSVWTWIFILNLKYDHGYKYFSLPNTSSI